MFKQALMFLSDADAAPLVLGQRWGWHPTLVIGRQHVVHLTLSASGVPWRQTAQYARLQAPRMAPFARAEGAFLRQGSVLHLWLWPADLVERAKARLGWSPTRSLRVLPESLWGMVPATGTVLQPCGSGVEALRFDSGQLQQSQWWPQTPQAEELAGLAGSSRVVEVRRTARDRIGGQRPWAWAMRGLGLQQAVAGPGAHPWSSAMVWVAVGWAALALSLGYGTWAWREGLALTQAKSQLQTQIDDWMRTRQVAAQARSQPAAAQDAAWTAAVREATQGVQLNTLLRQLAGPLAARGLQIYELVIERDSVKITLVSGFGGAVDLDLAVSALEQAGAREQLELLDTANTAQPRFAWKLPKGWS